MLCLKVRSSIIINVRNTEGGPFLMLRFEVRPFIKHVSNTEGSHFLCYVSSSVLLLDVRNTEGGPFLMLRFKVRSFIRYLKNTEGG